MRIKATEAASEMNVWFTDQEIEGLRWAAVSYRDDISIQLGAVIGLHAFEIPQVTPSRIKTTESGQYRLRIPEGKDTSGGSGKPRKASHPDAVDRTLQQFQNAENIAPRDPFIDLSGRGVRAALKRTAEAAADQTSEDDFRHLASHDLRRRVAQRLLIDEQVNPHVVMEVGGWSSVWAIDPSLNTPKRVSTRPSPASGTPTTDPSIIQ